MRRALPPLCALILGVAAALAVGCADRSHLIPPDRAAGLKGVLEQARQAVDSGNCSAAAAAVRQARTQAATLPSSVDSRLRRRIRQGIENVAATFPRDCAANQKPTTTETTPTTTTDTTPTTTETTPTTPTDTTPTTTETTPTTTDTTPSDGNGGTGGAPPP